jgi:N-acetylmuramoyl-L-alanine amidase
MAGTVRRADGVVSPLAIEDAPSPNFDLRHAPPDMAVLHYTGMKTGAAALDRLRDASAKVSAHYLIEEDGRVFRLVAEERRAWHAGRSFWKGERDINAVSIGIEMVNPGHEWGYRPFPDVQVEAVIALLDEIRERWEIPDARILGHSDVAPARKQDPGELFPWKALARAGHGLWFEPEPAPGGPLAEGAEGTGVFVLQAGLHRLGYEPAPSGRYDEDTVRTVAAFQRHWRPERIDGVACGDTRARLMAVLRLASVETVTGVI